MDTTDVCLHIDLLAWDRLNLSHTCRQIFTETDTRYYVLKLPPISDMVHNYFLIHMTPTLRYVACFTPAQLRAVTHVSTEWRIIKKPTGLVWIEASTGT
jgi:hypothetical protein